MIKTTLKQNTPLKSKFLDTSQNMFVVLEGLDGTGKSTQSRLLEKSLRLERKSTSGLQSKPENPFQRFIAYMDNNAEATHEYRTNSSSNRIILDRYVASTFASYKAETLECPSGLKWHEYYPKNLPLPHIVINIEISENERLLRIIDRGEESDSHENRLAQDFEYRYCFKEWLRAMSSVTINAGGLDVHELHQQILSKIKELVD